MPINAVSALQKKAAAAREIKNNIKNRLLMPSICSPAIQPARQFSTIIASGFRSVKELAAIADLSASLLIIEAPDGISPLRVMAGTSPVPLAAIAKHDVHAQHPLDADFSSVCPARPQFPALRHFNLVLEFTLNSLYG
jgi:hypothetical protein